MMIQKGQHGNSEISNLSIAYFFLPKSNYDMLKEQS